MSEIMEKQVKSKERVSNFGEVFTNEREVNAMLDLVMEESYRVDSRFLEPACGNGNFLVAILNRKLKTVVEENLDNLDDFHKQCFIAVSTIYGIDIQQDNCEESRERMLKIVQDIYQQVCSGNLDNLDNLDNLKTKVNSDLFFKNIKYLLDNNIIHGDGLTGLQEISKKDIVFSEWTFLENSYDVIRKDFTMNDMVAYGKRTSVNESSKKSQESNLFNLGGIKETVEELKPFREFKKVNFMKAYKLK